MSAKPPVSPLRVLMTNNTLGQRAGSEMYIRDVALALMRMGHLPVIYSPALGAVAEELERETIPVIDNLDKLGAPPDIIHGHHHHETMTAGLQFPDRPMIYVCHGWLPWEERPPLFPTIRRYVAVDDLCRERLLTTEGIDETKVATIYNFADTERFKPRPPLPERPRSALIFSNYTSVVHEEIRAACHAVGIEQVDVVGNAAGNPTSRPDELLPRYDVVFAKGRSAIEALVCGCAVVVADYSRFAGLVTMANLDGLRRFNFGVRTLQTAITRKDLRPVLAQYNAEDARAVSTIMRTEATLSRAAELYVSLYTEVLDGWDPARDAPPAADAVRYATRYLRWLSPTIKDRWHVQQNALKMERELQALREIDGKSSARLTEIERSNVALAREIEQMLLERAVSEQQMADLRRQIENMAVRLAQRDRELSEQTRATDEASAGLVEHQLDIARLGRQLKDASAQLVQCRKDLDSQIRETEATSARLALRERELADLKVKDVSAMLLLRERELASIKGSRAWRAVQSYGRLKNKIWVR